MAGRRSGQNQLLGGGHAEALFSRAFATTSKLGLRREATHQNILLATRQPQQGVRLEKRNFEARRVHLSPGSAAWRADRRKPETNAAQQTQHLAGRARGSIHFLFHPVIVRSDTNMYQPDLALKQQAKLQATGLTPPLHIHVHAVPACSHTFGAHQPSRQVSYKRLSKGPSRGRHWVAPGCHAAPQQQPTSHSAGGGSTKGVVIVSACN